MNEWNSAFVFGYGESQLITDQETKTVSNDDLTAIEPLVAYLASIQQGSEPITVQSMYSMNIYNSTFIDFLFNVEGAQPERFEWATLDQQLIDDLVDEMVAAPPQPQPVPEPEEEGAEMVEGGSERTAKAAKPAAKKAAAPHKDASHNHKKTAHHKKH